MVRTLPPWGEWDESAREDLIRILFEGQAVDLKGTGGLGTGVGRGCSPGAISAY